MNETDEPTKTVAIVVQSKVISVTPEKWLRLAELLASRLQHPVATVNLDAEESAECGLQASIEWYASQGFRRFVLVPLGLEPINLDCLLTVITWMRSVDLAIQIHVANAWTTKDWADAFLPPLSEACPQKQTVILVAQGGDAEERVGLELSSLAYHMQQTHDADVWYCFVKGCKPSLGETMRRMDLEGLHQFVFAAWRMNSDELSQLIDELGASHATELACEPIGIAWRWDRIAPRQPEPIELLEHAAWLHIVVARYLDALATRSVERYFGKRPGELNGGELNGLNVADRLGLVELDRRIDDMLPSEYQGRIDEVNLQSMGSASLSSDQFGLVRWDEVWTSFCDLAMAGGPPHRGRLLEAVAAVDVLKDVLAYESVVQEIRRGIEMITGLKTERAEALGWVGIVCDDEGMCTWLMRAIIVENVMVRREGRVLYLPAGPAFAVRKEIKNVITAVAKTVHYWRAHLKRA